VKTIEHYAFQSTAITSLTFGEDSVLESTGNNAFGNCVRLQEAILPSSLVSLGNSAFQSCTVLTNVTFLGEYPATTGTTIYGTQTQTPRVITYVYHDNCKTWVGKLEFDGDFDDESATWMNNRPIVCIGHPRDQWLMVSEIVKQSGNSIVGLAWKTNQIPFIDAEYVVYSSTDLTADIGTWTQHSSTNNAPLPLIINRNLGDMHRTTLNAVPDVQFFKVKAVK
jgi:hypothetical protein